MSQAIETGDVRDYFDQRAAFWETERQDYYTDKVREEVVRRGVFGPDDTVLDYGCGAGYLTEALIAAGVGKIVAVDVSANMLMALGDRLGDRVEGRFADGDRIPLDVGEVDGIVANMVLHHLEQPASFFWDCMRVLRPGGRVVVTDLVSYDGEAFAREQNDRWAGFERSAVMQWIEAAGFAEGAVTLVGERCCANVAATDGGTDIFLAYGRKI
ncbi:MAG: class I SAM-dependent methyltransferase [Geminicoccaceae bacterium]